MSRNLLPLLGATLILTVSPFGIAGAAGRDTAGECVTSTLIEESTQFTPYGVRRTSFSDAIVLEFKMGNQSATDGLAGRANVILPPHLGDFAGSDGAVYSYYGDVDKADRTGLTAEGFAALGGLLVQREPKNDAADYADTLLATLGERATKVCLGDGHAALVWADPDSSGTRTHNLYWSYSGDNYALIGVRTPQELLSLANGLITVS